MENMSVHRMAASERVSGNKVKSERQLKRYRFTDDRESRGGYVELFRNKVRIRVTG